jgi:nicotinamide-nucleotide amidase
MEIAFVSIGDELLDGRVRGRNAPRLGDLADRAGHRLVSALTVPDDGPAIGRTLNWASEVSELVVVSGGLGPTGDDVTRQAAAEWADRDLEFREDLREQLERRFERHGYTFTENNERQCYVPEGARVLPSDVGTASAFVLEHADTESWFLPGVPREFEWYLEEKLAERLAGSGNGCAANRSMTFLGLGESGLEMRISEAANRASQLGVSVGYRADAPLVEVLLRGDTEEDVEEVREQVLEAVGDWRVAEGGDDLPERLGTLLEERDATVATAESCTAGWISKAITTVPGSGSWFEYGFVTYANRAKTDLLGVDPETLEHHGAVSTETVREMASGARTHTSADYTVAVSGIAGPTGGTEEKPVGTVDFAVATPEGVYTRRLQFPPKSRHSVRHNSVQTALGLLIWHLDGLLERHSVEGPIPVDR